MSISSEKPGNREVIRYLKRLEARIARIESHLKLEPAEEAPPPEKVEPSPSEITESENELEFKIGEYWLAKVGIVALAIGIAFLLTLPYENLPLFLPSVFGYILTGVIFLLSHLFRKMFNYISRYLLGGGLVLLYFSTLRLHFFGPEPAISSMTAMLILLSAVVIFNLMVSVRRKSAYLASLNITLGYVTAIVINQTYIIFTLTIILAAASVYLSLKYRWRTIPFISIFLTYLVHLIWFMNNPLLTGKLELVSSPNISIFFILLYALIFAAGNLFRGKDIPEDALVVLSTFFNCSIAYGLYLLLTVTKFQTIIATSHLLASVLFLAVSIIFWVRKRSRYSTFFYAMVGYTALSVAIIAQFKEPDSLVWLGWQSLLVISTAIWFRSKFIIVANFAIYIIIFLVYLTMTEAVSTESLSFGVVALLSARIMNWKKDRLELKTEMMRNAYLLAGFFMFPYAFAHIVPVGYVSLSWVGVTVVYYILSRILNNKKYRWMALGTLLLTVARVFIVDLTVLQPAYRVASFLVLGIALLVMSLIYNRLRAKHTSSQAGQSE